MEQAARLIANPRPDREPTPSRRSLLSFFASTAVVAGVAAVPAAAAAAPVIQEAPEVLEIGRRLPMLVATYRAAADRRAAALAVYEANRPALPDDLIAPIWRRDLSAIVVDVDGRIVDNPKADCKLPLRVYNSRILHSYIYGQQVSRHTKEGKELRRLKRIAKAYETANDKALRESGYPERLEGVREVLAQIDELAMDLCKSSAATMAGVAIFAETCRLAIDAHKDVDIYPFEARHVVENLADRITEALIRIQANQAA